MKEPEIISFAEVMEPDTLARWETLCQSIRERVADYQPRLEKTETENGFILQWVGVPYEWIYGKTAKPAKIEKVMGSLNSVPFLGYAKNIVQYLSISREIFSLLADQSTNWEPFYVENLTLAFGLNDNHDLRYPQDDLNEIFHPMD